MGESGARLRQRVLAAVDEPRDRTFIGVLLDRCLQALADMREMEELIYAMYAETGHEVWELINARALLEALATRTLRGVKQLEALLNADRAFDDFAAEPAESLDDDVDLFGEAAPDPGDALQGEPGGDAGDIEGAVGRLLPDFRRNAKERLAAVRQQAEATGFGLRAQIADFHARFAAACENERYTQALRDVDDIRSALTDGVFALMATIAETYLGRLDRSDILPGHRSALDKALLVRQGLTELRRTINACNARVQAAGEVEIVRRRAYEHLCRTLADFLDSEVLRIVRPADRWELEGFGRRLRDLPLAEARLVCEGLDKFLDSLVSINQREVLIQHDRERSREVVELLEATGALLPVSLTGAAQLVRDAYDKAQALLGLRDDLDELLIAWRYGHADLLSEAEVRAAAEQLAGRL